MVLTYAIKGLQLSPRVGELLSTRNVFNLGDYGVAAKPRVGGFLSTPNVFNLGDYGVASKPLSGGIALHLERF